MNLKSCFWLPILFLMGAPLLQGQVAEEKLGAWYMYFWNTSFNEGPLGIQGDFQHRNWNFGGDLEQLLLRSGLTYQPKTSKAKLTVGYAHIWTGTPGDPTTTTQESRIYQEALLPHYLGGRFYLTHRFRYEQRFVEGQDFRTRYRYNLFLNLPINNPFIDEGTLYLALYNELFINGQREIGNGQTVELFDRNRSYVALGYAIKQSLKVQCGIMRQTTDNWAKNQVQLSLHHRF